ncbi:MAG: radical SAM protein [Fibrobacterales bacterium]|nr:radical SAM protein [Fibrobacterales bacterium]
MLNVHHILPESFVNGSGKRFVVWVQGCAFHCNGCWNPDTWSFAKNRLYSVKDLASMILSDETLDGVTFSGGEPFLQAAELTELVREIKRGSRLTIHVFTGFELNELTAPGARALVELTDTLVYGRFDPTKERNNQKVWRNPKGNDSWTFNNTDVEVEALPNGEINMSGFPTAELLADMEEMRHERV